MTSFNTLMVAYVESADDGAESVNSSTSQVGYSRGIEGSTDEASNGACYEIVHEAGLFRLE